MYLRRSANPPGDHVGSVSAWRRHTYDVRLVDDLLASRCAPLAAAIGSRRALLVTTPTVRRLYVEQVREELDRRGLRVGLLELPCDEATKSLEQVMRICDTARRLQLDREGLLVSIGGGVCSDLVTMAASWLRRGIGHVRVPTTLIGQVDAGIGIKGAVNFEGKKSYLGCFHAPAQVLVDPTFLRTVTEFHLRGGLAEMIKIALVRDARLFELIDEHGPALLESRFQDTDRAAHEMLWRSICRMLEELEPNLHEDNSYERLVDFGHTFSPLLESAAGFSIHHGEAVSVDIAVSAALAVEMGLLAPEPRDRVLDTIQRLGLPVRSPLIDATFCRRALVDAALHRGGRPNLVLPVGIGRACFVRSSDEVTEKALERALQLLEARAPAARDSVVC